MKRWAVLDALVPIILDYHRGPIVEIGSKLHPPDTPMRWKADSPNSINSTQVFCRHAQAYDVPLYTCDVKPLAQQFDKHTHFHGTSLEFIKTYDGPDPSIVLLDGCHIYTVVKQEFDFFWPRLIVEGVMFLHDTYPRKAKHCHPSFAGDVYKLRHELERRPDEMDCFTWPYGDMPSRVGMSMVIKKARDRPPFRR